MQTLQICTKSLIGKEIGCNSEGRHGACLRGDGPDRSNASGQETGRMQTAMVWLLLLGFYFVAVIWVAKVVLAAILHWAWHHKRLHQEMGSRNPTGLFWFH